MTTTHYPVNLEMWKEVWIRRIFKSWYPNIPKALCIVIFCGGQCGGESLHHVFREKCPTFCFHNIREFHEKYSKWTPVLSQRRRRCLEKIKPHDIFVWLTELFERVVIIDVYRCPIERALESLKKYPYEAFRKSNMTVSQWNRMTMMEKSNFFEHVMFHTIERRHGLDTEYGGYPVYLSNAKFRFLQDVSFDFHDRMLYTVHPMYSRIECMKIRWQDRQDWGHIFNDKKIFPFFVPSCAAKNNTPMKNQTDYNDEKDRLICSFLQLYTTSVNFSNMVLQSPMCVRYMSHDERVDCIYQRMYSMSEGHVFSPKVLRQNQHAVESAGGSL